MDLVLIAICVIVVLANLTAFSLFAVAVVEEERAKRKYSAEQEREKDRYLAAREELLRSLCRNMADLIESVVRQKANEKIVVESPSTESPVFADKSFRNAPSQSYVVSRIFSDVRTEARSPTGGPRLHRS